MAKGEKKVSISAVDNIIGERFLNMTSEEWYGVEVNIRKSIPFMETLSFVDDVVKSCFQKDGTFTPELMDFAIKSNIISRYTNVSLPDNLEHRYAILYGSDLVEFVCGHINMTQLQEIVKAANRKLSYACDTNVRGIEKNMNDILSAFESMQKQMEDAFAGVGPDDMKKLVGAIGDSNLTEEKVVEAFRSQYHEEPSTETAEAVK